MKFTCTVEIQKPLNETVNLWNNFENLKEWQDGFEGIEHISGTQGEPGAKTKMFYSSGKRKIILEETVIVNNLPEEFTGRYEAKEMVNTMKNSFSSKSDNSTIWTAEIEYSEFRGFIPKLMSKLMPGMFKKQTQKWLDQFKTFAESK